MVLGKEGFYPINKPILSIGENIDCIYDNGTLYFESFNKADQILNIKSHLINSTKPHMENFSKNPLFEFANVDWFLDIKDISLRQKVAATERKGVLRDKNITLNKIQNIAKKHNMDLKINDGKIVISKNKDSIMEVLSLLDEEIYRGAFTNEIYWSKKRTRFKKQNK